MFVCMLSLLCGPSILISHITGLARSSLCLSVCPIRASDLKTEWCRTIKIGVNVPPDWGSQHVSFWFKRSGLWLHSSRTAARYVVTGPTWLLVYYHRSIYKYLDRGLPSLSIAYGDPLKLTSPVQHASR